MKYLLIALFLIWPGSILAQEMFSPSYVLELEQVEATTEPKLHMLNELQLQRFTENGYIVETPQTHMLQFSISDNRLSLKKLNSQPTQTSTLLTTITSEDLFGYQLLAIPLQGLESINGDQITPTSCDGGSNTCTTTSAKEWRSLQSYGWGYNISGPDAAADFKNKQYFRPFKTGEQTVISSHEAANSQRSTELTIKVAVDNKISEGNYGSIIKLIALPKL